MRAFLAIIPPADVLDALEAHLAPRRDALAAEGRWRWTRAMHLHLTLAFLPELDDWREEDLVAEGRSVLDRVDQPPRLRLEGAGAFGDPGAARVLWAGVRQDSEDVLAGWARGLRAAASRVGAQVEGTRFVPHVTLARAIGRPGPAGHLLQALDTLVTPTWAVEEVHLLSSALGQGPGGTPRYAVRHTWRVGG